jgi:hypothetical protein
MTKTIFAVDPGVVSGWAVMTVEANPGILRHNSVNFHSKKDLYSAHRVVETICYERWGQKESQCAEPYLVPIEGQYLDEKKKNSRRNIDSLIKLSRNAGRWEEAACAHGLSYEYIQPSVWITKELGHGLQRDQIAAMAKQKCEALYRLKGLSEHEYCAILIGRYVAIREWRKGNER